MSKKILVTGVAGTGKSTLQTLFSEKGYQAEDIDKGFAEWRSKLTGATEEYRNDPEWHKGVEWELKSNELKLKLESVRNEPIIIFGSTNDLFEYVELFNVVFLLEYPDEESLVTRLGSRPQGQYGKEPHEKDAVISYYEDYQEQMKLRGAVSIDFTLSIKKVADIIEAEAQSE